MMVTLPVLTLVALVEVVPLGRLPREGDPRVEANDSLDGSTGQTLEAVPLVLGKPVEELTAHGRHLVGWKMFRDTVGEEVPHAFDVQLDDQLGGAEENPFHQIGHGPGSRPLGDLGIPKGGPELHQVTFELTENTILPGNVGGDVTLHPEAPLEVVGQVEPMDDLRLDAEQAFPQESIVGQRDHSLAFADGAIVQAVPGDEPRPRGATCLGGRSPSPTVLPAIPLGFPQLGHLLRVHAAKCQAQGPEEDRDGDAVEALLFCRCDLERPFRFRLGNQGFERDQPTVDQCGGENQHLLGVEDPEWSMDGGIEGAFARLLTVGRRGHSPAMSWAQVSNGRVRNASRLMRYSSRTAKMRFARWPR